MKLRKQLTEIHELRQKQSELYQQIRTLEAQENQLAKEVITQLPCEQWLQVNGGLIAYVQHSDNWNETAWHTNLNFEKLNRTEWTGEDSKLT